MQNHLPTGPRSPRLDKAQMPGRDSGSQGELELAEVAPLPPLPHQCPDRGYGLRNGHVGTLSPTLAGDYLAGNRPALSYTGTIEGPRHTRRRSTSPGGRAITTVDTRDAP